MKNVTWKLVPGPSFSNRGWAKFFTNTKRPGTSFQVVVFVELFNKIVFFCNIHTGQISLTDCDY